MKDKKLSKELKEIIVKGIDEYFEDRDIMIKRGLTDDTNNKITAKDRLEHIRNVFD